MSYARFGWDGSDVYVFTASDSGLECCGCILQEREWVKDPSAFFGGHLRPVGEMVKYRGLTTDEMVAHLRTHEIAGHHVPPEVYVELEEDRAETDAATGGGAA